MVTPVQAMFSIRPAQYEDVAALEARGRWKLYRFPVFMRRVIVALDSQGTLVGFCAFEVEERSREFRVYAIESHQKGAGRVLLDVVKERASRIVADSVLADAREWWERRGFTQFAPSDEEGTVGYFEWWREDEPCFDEQHFAALWPQTTLDRLIRDVQDQQRIERAMQRMMKPNTLSLVSVPTAFVEAVSEAVTRGQLAPEAAAIIQPYLEEAAQLQCEPLRRLVVWYSESLMHLVYLHAPPELVAGLNKLMSDYLLELERRGEF
jgi:hypothetical protein